MCAKRSPIWQFFTVTGDLNQFGKCHKCSRNVPRGGLTPKSFTTSNLVSNLRVSPPELEKEYNLLQNARREVTPESTEISPPSSSSRQLTLQEAADRTRVWATSDARALRITREMIAVDCQPLSIVSDPGFVRLLGTVEPCMKLPFHAIIIFFFFSCTNNKFYKNYSYFIGIGR